jgi:chemotaxis protein MotB
MAVVAPRKIIKKGGGGHHGGSWKVAYADFVTAMMALFMVLWIMSQGPEVREKIATYFTDPTGIPIQNTTTSVIEGTGTGFFDKLPVISPMEGGKGSGPNYVKPLTADDDQENLKKAAEEIKKQFLESPDLKDLAAAVTVQIDAEGLRIELTDQVEGTFFDLGSTVPKDNLRNAVRQIVGTIQGLENEVVIEGHTDARPYGGGEIGYSNWELSAERGNAVRRVMTRMGFAPGRVTEVRALADRMPLPDTSPLDGRNRRISLLVKNKFGPQPQAEAEAADVTPPSPPAANPLAEALKKD